MAAGASGNFTVNIRNPHTRRSYFRAVETFAAWCAERGLHNVAAITPMHVAAYVEQLGSIRSKPTVKQHLAAIRMLFDWLVTGHIMESNPGMQCEGRSTASGRARPPCSPPRRCTSCSPRLITLPCSGSATGP